jgi:hypothetical protein
VTGSAGRRTVERFAIAGALLAAAALLLPNSFAMALGGSHPILAARLAPSNARVATAAAAAIGGDPRKKEIRALVRTALARDLTVIAGIELRGADRAASGRQAEAARLFALSDRLSRRSLPTRLWLIQASVDRGDVAGALANFDLALRTSTEAPAILFPVLAKASADPTLTVPLARLLDRPSDWRLTYFEWALANGPDLSSLANMMMQMRDRRLIEENRLDQRLVELLVTKSEFTQAVHLKRRFDPKPAGLVADPHFADPSARYPFGWGLGSDGSIGAERSLAASGPVLAYRATAPRSGQVAAQLLILPPGNYRLETRTAAAATGVAPLWTLTCGDSGPGLAQLEQPLVAGAQAAAAFAVPQGCPAQWLVLRIRPSTETRVQAGEIDWVSIMRR